MPESTTSPQDSVRVARIGRPHGIRGDVTVQLYTDDPESRFVPGAVLEGRRGSGGRDGNLTVVRARWNKDILLLAFDEVTDRNGAEELRGTELFAAPDEPGEDEGWYEEDLIGLSVVVDGARVGAVSGLVTGEVQDLLQVTLDSGAEALVPFVEEIVPEVDLDAGTVTLDPPPGLLTLNEQEPGQP
ncbi:MULTISPECIES: ribosome maturation factor RimM [Micrococcaceae]|jgi:16S rRNA processing protein RimM|uniref:ribosome maturation factor RimM n=1 Tax=Micrococcaceae TaxID=1268 RepID=UPI00160E8B83|nr:MULTISPECIES: ribosome maturation factor RimM [Micrococcaceae]MBB5748473.1 16S rRNA processing protein RimM [Micrococcus sp. TA1]HRO31586.1 ribosome maturation factor RimM [Citricoccus sp.]HRO93654.1 ribosome maturation factor RimM [Citricoccus sp.]